MAIGSNKKTTVSKTPKSKRVTKNTATAERKTSSAKSPAKKLDLTAELMRIFRKKDPTLSKGDRLHLTSLAKSGGTKALSNAGFDELAKAVRHLV